MADAWKNKLYYGDNLDIMRDHIPDESVDLIYLDPPFKSDQSYNVIFNERNGSKSKAQIRAFEDTWVWDSEAQRTYEELLTEPDVPTNVSKMIEGMYKILGPTDMMSYLVMMAIRLLEMKKILKDTGSIYLHCDPTASHYLKLLMDSVFNFNFRNEIIWNYRKWPASKKQLQRNHDVILFYSKTDSEDRTFNYMADPMPRAGSTKKRFGNEEIVSGYDKNGNRKPSKTKDKKSKGVPRDDVWEISRVAPVKQLFPTQKPLKLLERILIYSSDPGDIVMDPFCGCGTTITVAEKLDRHWIGIDITHLAVSLMKHRLKDAFGPELSDYEVHGEPVDLKGARHLAKLDRFDFESWALSLSNVKARPVGGRGDEGIDGIINFFDEPGGRKTKTIIISVKSGNVKPSQVRDLRGTIEREEAEMGIFITLQEPTPGMKKDATVAGFYKNNFGKYPKLQIVTIKELLNGEKLDIPPRSTMENVSIKKAEKHKKKNNNQQSLFD